MRVAYLALGLGLLLSRADAGDWVVLPASDSSLVASLALAARVAGAKVRSLTAAALVGDSLQRDDVAIFLGARGYLATAHRDNDAVEAILAHLSAGGEVAVIASGRVFCRAETAAGLVRARPFPFPFAADLGLDNAGLPAGGPGGRIDIAPDWRETLAGMTFDVPVGDLALGIGAVPAAWRLDPVLALAGDDSGPRTVLGIIAPRRGSGKVVYAWAGLLASVDGRAAIARVLANRPRARTLLGPVISPQASRLAALRVQVAEARELLASRTGLEPQRFRASLSWYAAEIDRLVKETAANSGEAPLAGLSKLERDVAVTARAVAAWVAGHPVENDVSTPEGQGDREGGNPMVELLTNRGAIRIELLPEIAPRHVDNLLKLVREGFYDGLRFHRVVPGFVVQVGCPHSREDVHHPLVGTGGPGYTLPAELSDTPHVRGTVGMARSSDPDSAGSQFYVCLAEAHHLDRQYTVFGRVVGDTMSVVDQIVVGDVIEKAGVVDE